jgi:hypothetical protein
VNRERPSHLQLVVGDQPQPDPNVGRVEVTASIDWTRTETGLQPYMQVNWLDDTPPDPDWFHDELAALGRSVLDQERGTRTLASFHLHMLDSGDWRASWYVVHDGPEAIVGADETERTRAIERYLAHKALQRSVDDEQLARMFHEEYERLAPEHGYETRRDSAVPWEDVPERNRRLMVATVAAVLERLGVQRTGAPGYADGREGS